MELSQACLGLYGEAAKNTFVQLETLCVVNKAVNLVAIKLKIICETGYSVTRTRFKKFIVPSFLTGITRRFSILIGDDNDIEQSLDPTDYSKTYCLCKYSSEPNVSGVSRYWNVDSCYS